MIPSRLVFEEHAGDYDAWFNDHNNVNQAQLRMLRRAVPGFQRGLEVGVGSGRFAVTLGIHRGIDPSQNLVRMTRRRGVEVTLGEAEHQPYRAGSFDFVLMMMIICFLDSIPRRHIVCSDPGVHLSPGSSKRETRYFKNTGTSR